MQFLNMKSPKSKGLPVFIQTLIKFFTVDKAVQ